MGKEKMNNLKKVSRTLYSCRRCGMCGNKVTASVPYICPVRESTPGFDHFYARGKTVIAQGLLEGRIEPSKELAEVLFSCTLCSNCMTQCGSLNGDTGEALVDTTGIVQAMRADFLRNHPEWVDPAYQGVLNATRRYNNPWGLPRTARDKWAHGMELKQAGKEPAPVLLFVGCTMASSQALSGRARKAAQILQKAGVDFAVLGKDEPCCGSVQKRIGDPDLAGAMMEENISLFNGLGCKTIVTLCAGCTSMLKKEYAGAEKKLEPAVVHIVELLPRLLKENKLALKKNLSLRAVYHDPCHLGRYLGIYDQPREIISSVPGVTLLERAATKENTICCGAGGGMRIFESGALAEKIGRAAVEAAAGTGAEALVTACPFCEMNLDTAAKNSNSAIRIYDIIDLVHDAMS